MKKMSEKKTPVSARKPIKRKPKDKPKRPLSAYNFFFKEERDKIIKAVNCEDVNYQKEIDPELTEELINKLRKDSGKVSFEEMGKVIGRRWKDVEGERMEYYNALAGGDTERYKKDMEKYNQKQEDMRKQAKRSAEIPYASAQGHQMPPQRYPDMPTGPSGMYGGHMGYMPGYHMDPNAPHGYGQMPMMGSYGNHYYMSGPPHMNEGQYGNSGPSQIDSSSSSSFAAGSGPPPPPPHMSYPPQSDQPSHPGYVRSSEHYSYPPQTQTSSQSSESGMYQGPYPPQRNNSGQHDRRW